ncbi:hypothetical protein G210_5661, partial [Candida maltosa Xu316]
MSVTDPKYYSSRQILLLSQLLHTNDIDNYAKLKSFNPNKLQALISEWKQHKINGLNGQALNNTDSPIKLNTINQLLELYEKLLAKYEVDNTEELANTVYFMRIMELEDVIKKDQESFTEILQE